jgi:hypothetical protein
MCGSSVSARSQEARLCALAQIEYANMSAPVDPSGLDVIDKRDRRLPVRTPDPYVERLAPYIIGASRRPFSSTFGNDSVEHGKVMRFFGL